MTPPRPSPAPTWQAFLLLVVALAVAVVACGSSSKKPAVTPAAGLPNAAPTAVSTLAPAARDELLTFAASVLKVKTFTATMTLEPPGQPKRDGTVEAQLPDHFHVVLNSAPTNPSLEVIGIGSDSYAKLGGAWVKASPGAGVSLTFSPGQLGDLVNAVQSNRVTKAGTDKVNGADCQVYREATAEGSTEFCVANSLPLRIVSTSAGLKTTILFTSFDGPVDIKPPI